MFIEIAAAAWIIGSFVYHRLYDKKPSVNRRVTVPVIEEGAIYPIIYGRCRVQAPVLAWIGKPHIAQFNGVDPDLYCVGMFFLMGIPFLNGNQKLYTIWVSDLRMERNDAVFPHHGLDDLTGDGFDEPTSKPTVVSNISPGSPSMFDDAGGFIGGHVEFLNGNDQQVMTAGGFPVTRVAKHMVAAETGGVPVNTIPGYRRHLSVFMFAPYVIGGGHDYDTDPVSNPGFGWSLGPSAQVPSIQFEVSSYPEGTGLAGNNKVGQEANPADVIWDLLTAEMKLAMPFSRVDFASFEACAIKLLNEGHGYSRSLEEISNADDHIVDILRQIDAVLYEDPVDLKIKIKLIRGDYTLASIPSFDRTTCTVSNWNLSGWTGVPNKVRVVFNDRQFHYKENSATAQNMANAVGQDGEERELVLHFPGVCTLALAQVIASRELSAHSRPLATCKITVDRSYWRLVPGDVLALSYDEYGISDMLFRIGAVHRGDATDGSIHLECIQDFFFTHRGEIVGPFGPMRDDGGGRLPPFQRL